MKLSEKLKQYDSCGYFGRSLQGLPEMADALELRLDNIESQLASALAANQVMREALQAAQTALDTYDYTGAKDESEKYLKAERLCAEASAIKPGDVTLVEVGKVNEVGGSLFGSQYSPNNGVKVGDIVYTIKTKE